VSSTRARWAAVAAAVLPGVAALLAYRTVVHAWFFNDDFQILYELANGGDLVRFLLGPMFGHINTARNAFLAVEHALFGPTPAPFYGVALGIHVLNAVLLQRLGRRLGGSTAVATLVAVAWAASPMHAGTLSWCAAHGHALLTTLLLVLLLRLDARDVAERPLGTAGALGWLVVLLAIATLYGVGFGVAAAFPVALLMAAPQAATPRARLVLLATPPLLLALFALLHRLYPPPETAMLADVMPPLSQVLSRPDGVALLLVHLAGNGTASLVLGPFSLVARHRPDLVAACCAGVAVVVLAGLWRGTPHDRRWLVAALVLAFAAWGVVALGRGHQWATNPQAGSLGERYHYAAQTMVALAVAIALGVWTRRPPHAGTVVALGWAAAAVVGLVLRPLLIPLHAGERQQTAEALHAIYTAAVQTPPGETARVPNRSFQPVEFLALFQGRWTFPGLAGVFVIFVPEDTVDGRRVVFVATDPEQLAARARGGRIASLLVAP
jgi:hypothetical protein